MISESPPLLVDENSGPLPLVTVLMPVFNGERYLADALRSVLDQDYSAVEVLVIDDGSEHPESVSEICGSFNDPRIHLIRKENGGVSSALNAGLDAANGHLVAWLSHDDIFLPGKLSRQVAEWLALGSPRSLIMYTDYELLDESGTVTGHVRLRPAAKAADSRLTPIERGLVNGCTILVDRSALSSLGRFDEKLRCTQDFDMWIRAFERGFSFHHCPWESVGTRIHPGQGSFTSPYMIEENQSLWLRLANLVLLDTTTSTPSHRIRRLTGFLDFVAAAPYLAALDLAPIRAVIEPAVADAESALSLSAQATLRASGLRRAIVAWARRSYRWLRRYE